MGFVSIGIHILVYISYEMLQPFCKQNDQIYASFPNIFLDVHENFHVHKIRPPY